MPTLYDYEKWHRDLGCYDCRFAYQSSLGWQSCCRRGGCDGATSNCPHFARKPEPVVDQYNPRTEIVEGGSLVETAIQHAEYVTARMEGMLLRSKTSEGESGSKSDDDSESDNNLAEVIKSTKRKMEV